MSRFFLSIIAVVLLCTACNKESDDTIFVINEVMPSNKTGLPAADGKLHDWIEIRNISDHKANLKGYVLTTDSTKSKWSFPEQDLQPDECLLVYATKEKLDGQLSCGFNLKSDNVHLYLLSPEGKVMSKVEEKHVKSDKAVKRTKKGKYKETYKQTPGLDNNDENYAQYLRAKDSLCTSALRIWEYANRNTSSTAVDYRVPKFVELKNVSSEPVNLQDYALTCDLEDDEKVSLPQKTLQPGELYVYEDKQKLLKKPILILTCKDKYADGINASKTPLNTSIGRQKDSIGHFYFETPSLGKENTDGYQDVTDEPEPAVKPGVHDVENLDITFKETGAKIYYTLNGETPTKQSALYTNKISINKSTILKAIAVDSVNMASKVLTASYLLEKEHTLPVFSITVSEDDLYSETKGIYVLGPNAAPERPNKGANFWKPWEKLAHVEFFDGKKGFSSDCAIRIFGAYSRARDKKSFVIKFRDDVGKTTLDYDLYDRGKKDRLHSFVLRSGSQDDKGVMQRDEFFTSLMAEKCPSLHVQAYRPVAMYLNGSYFGLYYIREKINEHFVADHLNVKPNTVTLLEAQGAPKVGTADEYFELKSYVASHSMKDKEAYEYVKKRIDFESLIDYKLGEFYTGNCDVGNIRYFKSSSDKCDQKWKWLFYDLDWGFYYNTSLRFYIRENISRANGGSLAPYNIFVNRLLQNPEFRDLFLQRWAFHLNNTFCEENALKKFNSMAEIIAPEMERNCKRWTKMSYNHWQANLEKFRARIKARPAIMHENVLSELDVTEAEKAKYFGK